MKKAAFLAIISGILWGSTGPFVRLLDAGGLDNITIFSSRVLIAAVIMLIGILIHDRSLLKIKRNDLWLFLVCGCVSMTGLNVCYNAAIFHMPLSLAAVLLALSPVYVVILASFLFKEKVTTKKIICMILALFGCVLASGLLETASGNNVAPRWFLVGILSGIVYAFYSICSRIAGNRGYHALTITFYGSLFAAATLFLFTDWQAVGSYITSAPLSHGGILLIHSLMSSVLPYVFFTIALLHSETGLVSIIGAAGEPVAATVFGLIIYAEVPSILSFIGLAVTIAALAVLVSNGKK